MNLTKLNHTLQYVTFRLAQNLIGVNILDIREIVPCARITRVQQAPEFVMGLMNLRGQILTVLDIGVMLGLTKCRIHPDTHIFIFKHRDVGFAVDQTGDVIGTDPEHIEAVPANIESGIQKFLENIINLPDEVLMILNAKKLMSQTQYEVPKEY